MSVDESPPLNPTESVSEAEWWPRVVRRVDAYLSNNTIFFLLLVWILLVGAYLRLNGLDWDQRTHIHPDERFLTMVTGALQPPDSLKQYFDSTTSPLNPFNRGHTNFVYGTWPIFIVRYVAGWLHRTGYDQLHLVGRGLSGLFDLAGVVLIFLIGRRLYGDRVGLLAAALTALSVLNIQQSHFFTVDTFAAFFVLWTFYWAVRAAESDDWWPYILQGIGLGMAVASRINVIVLLAVIFLAAGQRLWARLDAIDARTAAPRVRRRAYVLALEMIGVRLAVSVVLAVLTFRVCQPYAFGGTSFFDFTLSKQFLDNMKYIRKLIGGQLDTPPGHQWTARTPLLFPWKNMVLWGLGLPLGLAAWAGWAVAAARLVWRREGKHLLPVAWVGLMFTYQGVQFVKSMRYLLPIFAPIIMLAAWLMVWLWRKLETGSWKLEAGDWKLEAGRAGLLLLVLGGTFAWAVAFTAIYRRPLSRVTASQWIYDHVPRGAVIANEHWDDPLPVRLAGRDPYGGLYKGVTLQMYDEDTPQKLDNIVRWLTEADYIVLSSARLYGSIPRLPMRYPMTTEYYRLLFAEQLGFHRVATFTSFPTLFGIQINDQSAEEIFTVYDHPRVDIFQKGDDFSPDRVRQLLGRFRLDRVLRLWPRQASAAHDALLLDEREWAVQRAGGTWSAIFDRGSLANRHPFVAWWLAVEVIGLLALPLAWLVFRSLPDRGYALAKTLGLLLMAYGAWLLASLRWLPFSRATIALVLVVVGLTSAAVVGRWRDELWAWLRRHWRLILLNEGLFLLCLLAFYLVRLGNPDLWHPARCGEKPMDFAYLNAIIRSTHFPPYDPWFAGGYINYYYFGQVIVATLIKLVGIVPAVAYNLAVPLLFALTATGAFCVVYNIAYRQSHIAYRQSVACGLLGALSVAVIGNLEEARLLLKSWGDLSKVSFPSTIPGFVPLVRAADGFWRWLVDGGKLAVPLDWWYWNATRVIAHGSGEPGPISEFPFFTFLYADLHAHMIALPLALLALGLMVSLVLGKGERKMGTRTQHVTRNNALRVMCCVLLLSLVLGALRATNTWDYPTYLLLAGGALLIGQIGRRGRLEWAGVVTAGVQFAAVVVLSNLLMWPFVSHYATAYGGLRLWKGVKTTLGNYVTIHGFFLFTIASFLIVETWRRRGRTAGSGRWAVLRSIVLRPARTALILAVGLALLLKLPVLVVALPLLGLAVFLLLWPRLPKSSETSEVLPGRLFCLLLIAVGLALTMVVEVIVIEGDIARMNTVFKFYLQVWVMWAIAAAVGLWDVAQAAREWSPGWRRAWWVAWTALLVCTALYTVGATQAKIRDRMVKGLPLSPDGMAFMTGEGATYTDQNRSIPLLQDYRAINWLLDNVRGSPVVLEAQTPEYRWGSRVSVYTGLPTVLGWAWHQKQQHSILPPYVIDWRLQDVRDIYNTTDPQQALELMKPYHVAYIYVGELERAYYAAEGLAKFEAMVGDTLDVVYDREGVRIYRVRGERGAPAEPLPGEEQATPGIVPQPAPRPESGGG